MSPSRSCKNTSVCDSVNTAIHRHYNLHLIMIVTIFSNHYNRLPPLAHLPHYRPLGLYKMKAELAYLGSAMRYVYNHVLHHRNIGRGSPERNEILHKIFRALKNFTKKHIETLWQQLVYLEFCNFEFSEEFALNDAVELLPVISLNCHQCSVSLLCTIKNQTLEIEQLYRRTLPPDGIMKTFSSLIQEGQLVWQIQKSLKLPSSFLNNNKILHQTLYRVLDCYGFLHHHDAVYFCYEGQCVIAHTHGILAPALKKFWSTLIWYSYVFWYKSNRKRATV